MLGSIIQVLGLRFQVLGSRRLILRFQPQILVFRLQSWGPCFQISGSDPEVQAPDVGLQALGLRCRLPACFPVCSGGWPGGKGSAAVGEGPARKPRGPGWGEQTGARRVRAPQRGRGAGGEGPSSETPPPPGPGRGLGRQAGPGCSRGLHARNPGPRARPRLKAQARRAPALKGVGCPPFFKGASPPPPPRESPGRCLGARILGYRQRCRDRDGDKKIWADFD